MSAFSRLVRTTLVPVALLGGSFAACNCSPKTPPGSLTIILPGGVSTFDATYDRDPATPGIQLQLGVSAEHLEGATVSLHLPGDTGTPPTGIVAKGAATVAFTLAQSGALYATAKDSAGRTVTSPKVNVTLNPAPQACHFVLPFAGQTLTANDDEATDAGFQYTVGLLCAGVELGNTVDLLVNGAKWGSAPLGAGGVAAFAKVELAEGDNALEADTKTNAGVAVKATESVKVDTGGCRILVAPPTGTVFNAKGEGAWDSVVADLEPGAPMQASLKITTDESCVGGDLAILNGADSLTTTVVSGTSMSVPVTLPDGTDAVRAVVSGAKHGASPLVTYTVDATVPTANLVFPLDGSALTDDDDSDAATAGLQIPVRGTFTGIDAGTAVSVVLDGQKVAGAATVDSEGAFSVPVTLADGDHTLVVSAARPSGTTASTATVSFHSTYLGASLALTSPTDGELFPLAKDADPATAGFQIAFALQAKNLAGETGQVSCGVASGSFTVGDDGSAVATVTIPDQGCGPSTIACRASVTAASGDVFETPRVQLVVDPTPPDVTLLEPTPDSVLGSNVTEVAATTSCPGEAQTATVVRGADVLAGPVAVTDNAIDFPEVTLPAGDSLVQLEVSDAAGNTTTVPFHVVVDTSTPQPAFVDPAAGDAPWSFTAADDENAELTDGFQHAVAVSLGNEPLGTSLQLYVADDLSETGAAGVQFHLARSVPTTFHDSATGGYKGVVFDLTLLPEGASTVRACATDLAGHLGCVEQKVVVSTGRPTCAVVAPTEGAFLGPNEDSDPATAGIQADVLLQTGAPDGSAAHLALARDGNALATLDATVVGGNPNGATFAAATFAEEGTYTLVATCTGADGTTSESLPTTVKVALAAPAVAIDEPVDGTVFNLAATDSSPAPGFQAHVEVSAQPGTFSPAGDVVTLTVTCSAGPQEPLTAVVDDGGEATFDVSLPDEDSCDLTAVLEDPAGNDSAPATSHVRTSRVAPTVSFDRPADGSLFGRSRDADAATDGFQLDLVRALVSGTTLAPTLAVGPTTIGAPTTVTPSGADGQIDDWALVPLAEGDNTLTVTVTDADGNSASAKETVTVDTQGPVVAIQSLVNGQVLAIRNDVDPATAGVQVNVGVSGQGLVSGTTVEICSPEAPADAPAADCGAGGRTGRLVAKATLSGGAAVVPKASLPDGQVTVYAVAVDLATNVSPPSDNVTVTVDSSQPKVTSLVVEQVVSGAGTPLDTQSGQAVFGPPQDSDQTKSGFQTRLVATVSGIEPGLGLRATFVDSNPAPGTVLGTAAIGADGSVLLDTTLLDGGHAIHVEAHDLAGNPVSTPQAPYAGDPPVLLNFGVKTSAPAVAIVSPGPGKLLAKDDADPATPGLQYDVTVDSDAGAGRPVDLYENGTTKIGTATLPLSGREATVRVTIDEGAESLTAQTSDAYGNAATSAAVALTVDSLAPIIAITSPTDGATVDTDADPNAAGFQLALTIAYGQVETGRPIVVSSGGVKLGQATTDGSGTAQLLVTVSNGQQTLTAQTSDATGNVTTSAGVGVTVTTGAPSIHFSSTDNPMYFGLANASPDGQSCQVTVDAACDTDGASATLSVGGVAGAPVTVASGAASFPLTIPAGQTVTLQLAATDGSGHTGYSATREATCDLTKPSVAVTSPTANPASYVAYGNPGGVTGALANKLPGTSLVADFTVKVTGADGGTVSLASDKDGALATQTVSGDGATVTFSNVTLTSKGTHTLTFTATSLAKNAGTETLTANVDVVAPGAADAVATIVDERASTIRLAFPAPGDDGSAGGRVTGYVVRRSSGQITDPTTWAAAKSVTVDPPVLVDPGASQALTVSGLPFENTYYFAVRALDAAGNLGPISALVAKADLHLARTHLAYPTASASNFSQVHTAMADLDGDGRDDLVMSLSSAGEVDVYYGQANLGSPATCADAPDCVALKGDSAAHFGSALAVGDVNGDGLPDLAVGAEWTSAPTSTPGTRDGAVYVYLSRANGRLSATSLPDAIIYGKLAATEPGTTITAGMGAEVKISPDVTGNGFSTILVGSPYENAHVGKVYVFRGRPTWPAVLTTTDDAFATINGLATDKAGKTYNFFGQHIAVLGDLNGDGHADFAASAAFGTSLRRPVWVVSGALALSTVSVDQVGASIASPTDNDRFGYDLAAPDANGDGKRDLVVSDSGTGGTPVTAYLFDGAAIGAALPASVGAGASVPDAAKVSTMPFGVAGFLLVERLGDLNGDGLEDFAGTVGGTSPINELHVFYGKKTWPASASPDVVVQTSGDPDEGASFGVRSAAGHFVSDPTGAPDLVVVDLAGHATVLSNP